MQAAMVEDFGKAPKVREIARPLAQEGELLLEVRAAALTNLVRGQASGSHYSSGTSASFTPGNDGIGVAEDGRRLYFISPRAPFGSMAEYTVVSASRTIEIAGELDDVTAAALGNPGVATWGALLGRARLQAGETVLVNGATGVSGRQAVQVAKYLGAARVIATGRTERGLEEVRALGADETILLTQDKTQLIEALRTAMAGTQVVLDYLWGEAAEAILQAASGRGRAEGEPRVRFVQIGAIAGGSIRLEGQTLRSSGVELLGSGLGSLSAREIVGALRQMYAAAATHAFQIATEAVPLSEVEEAWTRDTGGRRVVFVPGR